MVTSAILLIALASLASLLISNSSLINSNRATTLATEGLESVLEEMKSRDFDDIFAAYNATEADDLVGLEGNPGDGFDVEGLRARGDDPDGVVGSIEFPGDGVRLLENTVDAGLGMPRDLNGDGEVDGDDHSGDYVILPVRVRVEWGGAAGDRALEFVTVISDV